jgi:hypothetical protein
MENNLQEEGTITQDKNPSELETDSLKIVHNLKIRDVIQKPKCEPL